MRQDADRARAKEMFRNMTTKEKVKHIFGYYWLHMLAGILGLVLAVSFVTSWRASVATRDLLYIGIQDECYYLLQPKVEELAQQAQWPEGLNFLAFPSAKSEDGMGSMQLSMYLTADEMDFMVCDEYTMRLLASDETMNCDITPLEDTRLGAGKDIEQGWFLLTLSGTARAEKAQQFMPILLGAAS